MRLLLTSGGVTNPTIRAALVDMLGKPIEECDALIVPTAQHGHPMCSPSSLWNAIAGEGMAQLGWRCVGVLELTALPGIDPERWQPWVRAADVLLVDGGEATYLAHWMRESGLAALLPELQDTVWVGVSAGSMVLTPRIGDAFVEWHGSGDGSVHGDETLGLVGFSIFPHLDYPGWEENTTERAHRWAAGMDVPCYAIDDQTAISVVDGTVEVISEGHWEQLGTD